MGFWLPPVGLSLWWHGCSPLVQIPTISIPSIPYDSGIDSYRYRLSGIFAKPGVGFRLEDFVQSTYAICPLLFYKQRHILINENDISIPYAVSVIPKDKLNLLPL
jgi:hypothetical protein